MRVAFVSSLPVGGPVEQALVLTGGLAALGVEVQAVCATDGLSTRFADAGAQAVTIPLGSWRERVADRLAVRAVAGADVVHGQDRRAGLSVAMGPRPTPGGVRVYTVHGLPEPYLPVPVGPRRPGVRGALAYRVVESTLSRRHDAIVVPSSAVATILRERVGFPPGRLHVIPNGVAVGQQGVAPPVHRSVVGTVSVLAPVKALDVFLEAAARLADRRPTLRFVLVGDGPDRQRLEHRVHTLGLADRVEFPGHLPAGDAFGRLGIFVLCSYMESSPMALLEAMAAGVPVVATRVGGVPEMADDRTAQLVPPGDPELLAAAIGRLLDDPALRERQAEAARARIATSFTDVKNAQTTLALYDRLLSARQGR